MDRKEKKDSVIEAETNSLLYCLQVCISRGFKQILIEVDSSLLVHMIKGRIANWKMFNKIIHIAALLEPSGSTIAHVYREKNQVAYWMAKHSLKNNEEYV
ncbi:hypothetical protein Leryth_001701 [Lithospermum erythrorhizon]|nr:hypothetical protein Leryth_001701 [Lithospermum erythrorhizon]